MHFMTTHEQRPNMKTSTRAWLLAIVLPLVLTACISLPISYSADSITATVVDAETGAPLEGVIVVAHWQLTHGTVGGTTPTDQLMVMEAVTGKEGVFHFPAWGPKTVWNGDMLINQDPELLLFKPGYEYRSLRNTNTYQMDQLTRNQRTSEWNKRTIALRPFRGGGQEYAEHLRDFSSLRLYEIYQGSCNWKLTPRMLLALRIQDQQLRSQAIRTSFMHAGYVRTNPEKCGDPDVFFKDYRQ
jgi:hypothetical protein